MTVPSKMATLPFVAMAVELLGLPVNTCITQVVKCHNLFKPFKTIYPVESLILLQFVYDPT